MRPCGCRTLAALLLAAVAGTAAAAVALPPVDAFYDAIGIRVAAREQAQFVVGDNLSGFYEGITHAYGKNAQGAPVGYTIGKDLVLHGYASLVDGRLNARHSGGTETILPYGHRVAYAKGTAEEMALLSKQQALAFTVRSAKPATLALLPLLPLPLEQYRQSRLGNSLVLVPAAAHGPCLAFSAAQEFDVATIAAPAPLQGPALALRTRARATSLNVVAAFAATADAAAQAADKLAAGEALQQERQSRYARLNASHLWTSDAAYNRALVWAKAASELFVVEEFGTGIWAGLPWFRDNWGRDTFIALPGTLLVAGRFDTAKAVLQNFARYQNLKDPQHKDYGRIPNRVAAGDSIIYNTVDGTPWMLREALEYLRYTGDRDFAAHMYRLALPYFEGALRHHVDSDGLLTHDDADTWMDARINNGLAWSPRGPRAVEIQALWYAALRAGADLAQIVGDAGQAGRWRAAAAQARASFLRLFWDGATMADRLRADGSRDTKLRPNQLMLVSIPFDDFIAPEVQAQILRNAVNGLLYPHGIASLSQDDRYFHPRHVNPDWHHKDAAYHQGTIWGWNAGFTVTALSKFGRQDMAYALTQNLGRQITGLGTRGNMSELLDALPDAQGRLKPSGTYAQSWSVAEFARNAYQDYLGFRPDLLSGKLVLAPALPAAWQQFSARLPFGADAALELGFARQGTRQQWTLRSSANSPVRSVEMQFLNPDRSRSRVEFDLAPDTPAVLTLDRGQARLDGRLLASEAFQPSFAALTGDLKFVTPKTYRAQDFPMLRRRDGLQHEIESGAYR